MSTKKIGIREIAERAGIAISTVSHALNGTASISDEVRARVLAIATETGYLAKRQAKAAIATITKVMIAVPQDALPQSDVNLVSWTILSSLTRACEERGVPVVPFALPENGDAKALIQAARDAQVDGLIILNQDDGPFLQALCDCDIPTVLINGEDPSMLLDSVTPGNRFAAQMATEWLVAQGHKRIIHLTWPGRKTVRRRMDGFLDAIEKSGTGGSRDDVLMADGFAPAFGEARMAAWLAENAGLGDVTAVFCAADNLAFGAIKAFTSAGYNVPGDISVMGFDGIALGAFHSPALSTVSVPLEEFAAEALALIQQRKLTSGAARAARRVELGCTIVNRDSVRSLSDS